MPAARTLAFCGVRFTIPCYVLAALATARASELTRPPFLCPVLMSAPRLQLVQGVGQKAAGKGLNPFQSHHRGAPARADGRGVYKPISATCTETGAACRVKGQREVGGGAPRYATPRRAARPPDAPVVEVPVSTGLRRAGLARGDGSGT